jgi:diadenosine tetraphosphate (Ap4A) HIT family hydrolase
VNADMHQKVNADHLKRDAYLYIRQSTLRQVLENTKSTKRQYALRQSAVALGWPIERIIVIDNDLGQLGASAADREGFQKLVADVGMGKAGIVLGLEVSRLARNSTDWHRLLGIAVPAAQPVTPGHVVVAPRHHVGGFYDLDVEEQRGLWDLGAEVRRHVVAALHVESAAIGFEDCEEDQGHTHVHVVPRRPGVELPDGIEWVTK